MGEPDVCVVDSTYRVHAKTVADGVQCAVRYPLSCVALPWVEACEKWLQRQRLLHHDCAYRHRPRRLLWFFGSCAPWGRAARSGFLGTEERRCLQRCCA